MKQLLFCDDGKVDAVAPLCRAHGLGIEVQAFYDPALVEREPDAVERHRKALGQLEPRSMHGPFGDLCPGSFDELVRNVARSRFDQAFEVAGRLGADHIVLHHGYVPGTSSPQGWLKRCPEFWREYLQGKAGEIVFHVENMLEWEPDLLGDVVAAIGDPRVDVLLDIGHAHGHGHVPVLKWIERLGRQIGYVHLHDNHGESDEHLALGRGTIPLTEVFSALEQYAPKAIWAIETAPADLEPSLTWLREHRLTSA